AELLHRHDRALAVEAGEQGGGQIDLGVVGVVVGDDRESGPGGLGVVGAYGLLVGAIGVGRQQEDAAAALLGGLLGPAAGGGAAAPGAVGAAGGGGGGGHGARIPSGLCDIA